MGTEQRNRLSLSRRNALKNVIRLIPAVVIMVVMLSAVSCNNNNGLLPQDNGGGPNLRLVLRRLAPARSRS